MVRADAFCPSDFASDFALGPVFPPTLKRLATAAQGSGRLMASLDGTTTPPADGVL